MRDLPTKWLLLLATAPLFMIRALAALGPITGVALKGDTLVLSVGVDTVVVHVCRSDLLKVDYRPQGRSSPSTPILATTNWPAVGASINTNGDPIVIATDRLRAEIARSPCRLSLYTAGSTNVLLKERASEGVFADGVRFDHKTGSDFYGISGYNAWESSSAGMLRNSGGWVEAGYQGDCGAPLAWSRDGYGVLVDSDGGQFTINSTNLTFEYCSKTNIEYYLAVGTPDQILSAVAEVSGKPPLFPKWAMGFANTEWDITQSELTNIVNTYRAREIPIDHYILDFDWKAWGENNYGEWRWNTNKFPGGPTGVLQAQMRARGMHLAGIMKPRIHVNTVQGNYASSHGFWWPGSSAYVDYFSGQMVNDLNFGLADCRAWYWDHITNTFSTGITGWWNDEADQQGGGGGFFNNWQFMNMQKGLYEGQRGYSTQRVWSINRNFYLGAQRYAYAMWSGDIDSGFSAMAAQRERMLSALNLGQAYWGMDIGGFGGDPSPENYARWIQFGAFVPVFRVHGQRYAQRQPWVYGATAEAAAKAAIQLRYRLIPYLYSYARRLTETGIGIVRPLFHAFPADANLANYKEAWLFGDWLLVSPVVVQGQSSKNIYLPAGTWYDYSKGTRYVGGQTIAYPLDTATWADIPLFIRRGAILPTQPVMNYVGERTLTNVYVDIFPDPSPTSFTYYDDDGISYAYEAGRFFKQTFTAQDLGESIVVGISPPAGTFESGLQTWFCRIYCPTSTSVTINGLAATHYATTSALEAAPGEGWAEGTSPFGHLVAVKLAASAQKTIVISHNTVAAPEFDPPGGLFTGGLLVTITCATPGAVVRYTVDGSEPDETKSVYVEPLLISTTTTLKAKAFKAGRVPSPTAIASFVRDDNLLRNPGFELEGSSTNKALYWTLGEPDSHGETWGSALRVSWRSYSGSWEGTVRGTWAGAGREGGMWQEAPAVAGRTYLFSAWFWADSNWSPGSQGMKLEFFSGVDRGVTMLCAFTNRFTGIGPQWTNYSLRATAPTNTTWVRVVIFASQVSANGALQFDDLRLIPLNVHNLTIRSPHGNPVPAVGTHLVDHGRLITNSVNSPVNAGMTQYVCTGWTLTGHWPTSGAGHVMTLVITNDAMLTWQWITNLLNPGVLCFSAATYEVPESSPSALLSVMRADGSNGEVIVSYRTTGGTATAGRDYTAATGTVTLADGMTSNTLTIHLFDDLQYEADETILVTLEHPVGATLAAPYEAVLTILDDDVDLGTRTLEVMSEHGQADPAIGAHVYDYGIRLICSVTGVVVNGDTQYACAGWTGTGSVPATPPPGYVDSTPAFLLTNDSSITWLWITNVLFQCVAGPNGAVTGDPGGWYPWGGSVTVTAVPAAAYDFAGWAGDVPTGQIRQNPLTLLLDQARAILATFAPRVGQNLLNNPGFEQAGVSADRALYWNLGDPDVHGQMWGTAIRINWRSHSGSWQGTIRGTWSGAGTEGGCWQEVPAVPGRPYRFSAWFWADDGNPYGPWAAAEQVMKIEFFSGATQGITMLSASTNSLAGIGQTWENRGLTATAPTNADWVRVVILARGVSADGALQFDDLELALVEALEAPVILQMNPTGTTSFTVRWTAVPKATGYIVDVASNALFRPPTRATDLFISEYGEGTDNNKYIEICNRTGSSADLSKYRIWGIRNGGNWFESSLSLSNTLADGAVHVVVNSACTNTLINAAAHQFAANAPPMDFTGDDAVGLAKVIGVVTTLIDAVGTSGPDPGTGWGVAGTPDATFDHTLVRKSTVTGGNTNWLTCTNEWMVFPVDTLAFLGWHEMDRLPGDFVPGYEARAAGTATSLEITGLTAGVTYFLRVQATNELTSSPYSEPFEVTTFWPRPSQHAGDIRFGEVGTDHMTLSWRPGDGAARLVVAREDHAVNWSPTDRVHYEAASDFTAAPLQGDGNRVVYNGPGTNVAVTGLEPGTRYHFKIFEYLGSNGAEAYYTGGDPAAGSRATFAAAYGILAVAGEHGTIEPAGLVMVPFGQSTGFVVTADTYYAIEAIHTNGVPLPLASGLSTYTTWWHEVCSTGIVSASFTPRRATQYGTPWWWLAQYELTNDWADFDAAELLDTDSDTLPAWAEYVAGTDPTNGQSVLKLSENVITTTEGPVLSWSSVSNRYYHVYIATNLHEDFECLTQDLPADVPMNTYTDVVMRTEPRLFYRVRVSLQPGQEGCF